MEDPAFSTAEVDENTQTILLHASNHDLAALKPLLRIPGNASAQDPETGYTPLHAAIASCGPSIVERKENEGPDDGDDAVNVGKAKSLVRELFLSGAIWNDLDTNNETPGCLAWRLGQKELYELCVEAGVRAEMLLGLMGGYEELSSEEEEEAEDIDDAAGDKNAVQDIEHGESAREDAEIKIRRDVNSEDYLKSALKFEDDKLLDADNNGVMMAWESEIMQKTVDRLLLSTPQGPKTGKKILNIGFGMGIIDRLFRETKPHVHYIIEAHEAVLTQLSSPDSDFGKTWEDSASELDSYKIHAGKWQDIVPKMIESGLVFDAIYFDTFGEDYSQLKLFFSEFVPGLLDERGTFGFFNGLGADRRVCYDVYCRVAELDLCDAGLDVEWTDVLVEELGGHGEGEWKGVRRRYWTLDNYRLPICSFMR